MSAVNRFVLPKNISERKFYAAPRGCEVYVQYYEALAMPYDTFRWTTIWDFVVPPIELVVFLREGCELPLGPAWDE